MVVVLLLLLERTDDEPLDLETLQCVYRFCGNSLARVSYALGVYSYLFGKGAVLDDRYERNDAD